MQFIAFGIFSNFKLIEACITSRWISKESILTCGGEEPTAKVSCVGYAQGYRLLNIYANATGHYRMVCPHHGHKCHCLTRLYWSSHFNTSLSFTELQLSPPIRKFRRAESGSGGGDIDGLPNQNGLIISLQKTPFSVLKCSQVLVPLRRLLSVNA